MECEEPGGTSGSSRNENESGKFKDVQYRPSPLRISKVSHKIRKASVPLPAVQQKRPIIIHTYSPKIIQTQPNNFMWLVQSLTGSADTRSRCQKNKPGDSGETLVIHGQDDQKPVKLSTGSSVTGDGKIRIDHTRIESERFYEQESSILHDSSSESEGLVQLAAADHDHVVQKSCGNANSVDASPRGPLPTFDNNIFSNIPPAPCFDSFDQVYQGVTFPLSDPCISSAFSCNSFPDLLVTSSNHESVASSFPKDFLSVPSIASSNWNVDGMSFLNPPFKNSKQNCFPVPFSFRQSPTIWDSRTMEQPGDANMYRGFDDVYVADHALLTGRVTF